MSQSHDIKGGTADEVFQGTSGAVFSVGEESAPWNGLLLDL